MAGLCLSEISGIDKSTETESRLVVAGDRKGGGEMGNNCLMGRGFYLE